MSPVPEDLDYLATRVHARYGSRAAALDLESLVRLRTPERLSHALWPEAGPASAPAREVQRRLAQEWARELERLAEGMHGARAQLLEELARGPELEDRKLLVRGLAAGVPTAALVPHLLRLPPAASGALRNPEDVLDAPAPDPGSAPEHQAGGASLPEPLALETTLDRSHLVRLVAALDGLGSRDQRALRALVHQEVDAFHLMLVARGRFTHGLAADALVRWHVPGAGIDRARLGEMLAAPALSVAAAMAVGAAVDELPAGPVDPAALDAAAWRRRLRLAQRTFREGRTRFATVVGYSVWRRVEVRDLGAVSEGLRLGLDAGAIAPHLVRRAPEVARA